MTTSLNHPWRNDITGLRAIAVLPVLIYHAFPDFLRGGYFGVDIFFVISGYLISGIIFRGIAKDKFNYLDFYDKRIRRIIPSLLLLFVFVSLLAFIILFPFEYSQIGREIYSSAGFYQNFQLLSGAGYFDEASLRKPLLHLWSLAIEEQFYIIFPIICLAIWKIFKTQTSLGTVVGLIVIGSLCCCFFSKDQTFSFYFPLTRFWELGFGIMLAYAETFSYLDPKKIPIHIRNLISTLGFLFIFGAILIVEKDAFHPGPVTLFPVIGSVCIILSVDAWINRTILSWKPIVFVGLISYSLYLWHWPLLSYFYILNVPQENSFTVKIFLLFLSFILATFAYYYVENPARRYQKIYGKHLSIILLFLPHPIRWLGTMYEIFIKPSHNFQCLHK